MNKDIKRPGSKDWNPGTAIYSVWLKTLTPEEYAAHIAKRAARKSMKAAMKEVQDHFRDTLLAQLYNGLQKQIHKAVVDGDTAAFQAVWDRTVGRPATMPSMDTDLDPNDKALPWTDDTSK